MSKRNSSEGDNRFRVRPGKPRQRGDTFIAQVLRQTSKAAGATGGKRGMGGKAGGKTTGKAPGSRLVHRSIKTFT